MNDTERNWKPAGLPDVARPSAPHPLHLSGKLRTQLTSIHRPLTPPASTTASASFVYLRPMRADDYRRIVGFWEENREPLRMPADSFANVATFLQRHPGLSIVAEKGEQVLGTALCSEDGRAGYIQHFVVAPGADRQAVVQVMLRRCVLQFNALSLTLCFLLSERGVRSVELGRTAPESLSECVSALAG